MMLNSNFYKSSHFDVIVRNKIGQEALGGAMRSILSAKEITTLRKVGVCPFSSHSLPREKRRP